MTYNDRGATLADRRDARVTRNEQRHTGMTVATALCVVGLGALLAGFNGSIGWWIGAGGLFGSATVIGIKNW